MRTNTVKEKWARGEMTYGGWLSIPSSFSAEVMAHQGLDWVCIDMQHGLVDYQVALTMLQAIGSTPTIPFVRVPWNEFGIIGKVLDAGAMGVIIPMVNSAEEAKAAVAACRYFPDGSRSFGPTRAAYYAGSDYFRGANQEIACIPMIETGQAVDRLDEILSVPGVDAVYVGPADLSITLGLPPGMNNGEPFESARVKIAKACAAHGVTAGIHANAQLAAKHGEAGYRMVTITSDAGSIAIQAQADLKVAKGTADGTKPVYG
ncbi:MAG: 2,4-dihydroxyhept-2-ene-1,7-dioic acid aldolase [Dehalococcoidia bacterium]|nr:2,4-dihydroxyhept-2-ene-1,7-dioic acid aldolase [Dehalococcoidia bacterium]